MNGKVVFRYSEKGTKWWRNNTLGIQHIYPPGAIGLDSDPALLRIARNTIAVMGRWNDFNGTNSFYPAAVRVGHDPEEILARLAAWSAMKYPNGLKHGRNPHGIEMCSPVPNTINMMLCMGHQGVLRVFRVWPRDRDARFHNIRTFGAFLVIGELADGQVRSLRIVSEQGRDLTVENPWPERPVRVVRNGGRAEVCSGPRFTLSTAKGETIELCPEG